MVVVVVGVFGLTVLPRYTMIGVTPVLYIGWKVFKKTKIHKSEEIDLTENLKEIEDYHVNYVPTPARYVSGSRTC